MSADVTRIELAKALKAIKAVATKEQFEETKKIFIQPGGEDSVMSAVNGLSEEDEFALLTKLLGTAKHIVGFEQRPLVQGEYIVADYYLTLNPGCSVHGKGRDKFPDFKCVVDVKSTEKDLFKIGGNRLQRLRNFADLFNLPLFFAVRFLRFNHNALWAIVEDKDRTSTFLHVNYEDVVTGLRQVFWDEYSLMVNPKLIIIAKYSKKSTVNSVKHNVFGSQMELIFAEHDKILLTLLGQDSFMASAFMEAYNLQEFQVQEVDNDITLQFLKPEIATGFLADLIFKFNRLPVDEFGRIIYDASKLIVRSDTDAHERLINREKIEAIISPLIANRVLFVGEIGDHLEKWKSLGGVD